MQSEEKDNNVDNSALSDVWQQLLGKKAQEHNAEGDNPAQPSVPTLDGDPWSSLARSIGIEAIDLEKLHLEMSEQDLEQILQMMQELPPLKKEDEK